MGKVSWDKDQRAKAKEQKVPLISMAYDGATLPNGETGRYAMKIDGPAPPKFVKRFQKFMTEFIKAMAALGPEKGD